MDKNKIILLHEVMEDVECSECPFDKRCDFLIDNYEEDFCQSIKNILRGKNNV